METLSVGMYVKFKTLSNQVKVGQIQLIDNSIYELDNNEVTADKYIVKASHNMIDLIEVGDYLNGFKVSKIERYDTNTIIKIGNSTFNVLEGEEIYTPSYDNNNGYEKLEKLKSIVTKEQMESMKYSLGEE